MSLLVSRAGKIKVPEWVDLVKTGRHKELAPVDEDWFYTRCAAVARQLATRGPLGVGSIRRLYGGPIRRGVKGVKHCHGSATVAKKALQALEGIKWVEKAPHGGRRLTSLGKRDLDRIAVQVRKRTKKQQNLENFQLTQV